MGVLYVDLSKAFDTNHSALLEKLKSFEITGDSHNWFTDYLFNRRQFCLVENCESKLLNITWGVPQGSILGPLLFLMFFTDFEICLKCSQFLHFANNTIVHVHGKTKDIVESQLNQDLKNMSTYFKTNQLITNLNKGKTETMIFGMSSRLSKCGKKLTLYYDDRVIHATETYKYLGTILDRTLSLSTNLDRMYKKTTSMLRRLYLLCTNFDSPKKSQDIPGNDSSLHHF